MADPKPSKAAKARMKPYIDRHLELVNAVIDLSDDALDDLSKAARAYTTTNCWFRDYDAAQIVLEAISDVRASRKPSKP